MRLPQPSGVKGDSLYMPMEHAAYLAKPDYICSEKDHTQHRAAPRRSPDPTSAELPKRRRGQWQNHASDRALPYKPLVFTPTHRQRDAGQGRPGPDLSQLLPLERPNGLDARKDGTEIRSPCDHLGRRLHSAPPYSGNLPRLARGSRRPGHHSAVATRDSRPQSPEKCHTTGSVGMPPITKRSR